MVSATPAKVAIVYPGDREARSTASADTSRFRPVFEALSELGARVEPAVYHDEFADDVERQLEQVDVVLVWVNPIEGGRDRSVLDAMLRTVAASGVFVSAHPDVILRMGTKEVLYRTRHMGWGSDTHLYSSIAEFQLRFPEQLARGEARVLKQYRGNGGVGVWKVHWVRDASHVHATLRADTKIRVRHAQRGSIEEEIALGEFLARCEPYFAGAGRIVDQAYQTRLTDGMVRCYLVGDRVAGFGHQAINALYPAPPGALPEDAPPPGPRLYHPPTKPEFQVLKRTLEEKWVPEMRQLLGVDTDSLPLIWDADFLFGPPDDSGRDTYVLCEINASSVSPFPDAAIPLLAQAALDRARERASKR